MEILRFDVSRAERITEYKSRLAAALKVADGEGEAHAYVVYLEPGGEIGSHAAGFGQLFFAVAGSGWVAGGDGERMLLGEGDAAFIRRGETHSKGSETGMTAFMVQVHDFEPGSA
ncbi:MAG TPA: cupin domain-containing protein [Gaiellaceae bacterium]|jgi:quercetin dioxygenase-like cupin family protein